ncbi:MAG: hypothetical protein OEX04_21075, partial [Acidimicrobiia bacterium]|nr:hypothetical protein [Acidimicrobiia bacterium]
MTITAEPERTRGIALEEIRSPAAHCRYPGIGVVGLCAHALPRRAGRGLGRPPPDVPVGARQEIHISAQMTPIRTGTSHAR